MDYEESEDAVACPFCDEGWNCDHLVASMDMSFLSLESGALSEWMASICLWAGEAAVRRLRTEPDVAERVRHPNLKELYGDVRYELGELAKEIPETSVISVRTLESHLLYLSDELLPMLDVEMPDDSIYEGNSPGYSSVMKVYWARDPEKVLDQLEERIVGMISAAK